jgi:hypothetical protein
MAMFEAARRWSEARRGRFLFGLASAVALAIAVASCSLGNVTHDDCVSDAQCSAGFGAGSRCDQGFCTAATSPGCQKTGADGRACFGCTPKTTVDYLNACSDATCSPFDDKRLTKLTPDGGLPSLP